MATNTHCILRFRRCRTSSSETDNHGPRLPLRWTTRMGAAGTMTSLALQLLRPKRASRVSALPMRAPEQQRGAFIRMTSEASVCAKLTIRRRRNGWLVSRREIARCEPRYNQTEPAKPSEAP